MGKMDLIPITPLLSPELLAGCCLQSVVLAWERQQAGDLSDPGPLLEAQGLGTRAGPAACTVPSPAADAGAHASLTATDLEACAWRPKGPDVQPLPPTPEAS